MTDSILQNYIQHFRNYLADYQSDDSDLKFHINMKEQHTYRVVAYAKELAQQLKLTTRQQQLAQLIALFHDLGRFEQYRKYRTFRDAESVNHAELSLTELEKFKLNQYLSPIEHHLVCLAIRLHNAIALPDSLTPHEKTFSTLIRDCDKLDIFYVLEEFLTPPGTEGCSPILLDDLKQGRQSLFTNMKTAEDRKLIRLCWVYDIHYAWTMEKLLQQQRIDKIFKYLPQTPDIKSIQQTLITYMQKKAAELHV